MEIERIREAEGSFVGMHPHGESVKQMLQRCAFSSRVKSVKSSHQVAIIKLTNAMKIVIDMYEPPARHEAVSGSVRSVTQFSRKEQTVSNESNVYVRHIHFNPLLYGGCSKPKISSSRLYILIKHDCTTNTGI